MLTGLSGCFIVHIDNGAALESLTETNFYGEALQNCLRLIFGAFACQQELW